MDDNNIKLNLKYASEVLDGIENLPKGSVCLVKSQTMTGKTTAILGNEKLGIKGLIDKIRDKSLIYLCNRITLKRQLKLDLCKKYNIDIPKNDDGTIDYKELDKLENIGKVTIMSYQSLEENVRKRESFIAETDYWHKCNLFELDYDYIVCDEFHYILKDAGFNGKTRLSFTEITKCWYTNSVLIYMTATDEEVKPIIENTLSILEKYNLGEMQFTKDKYFHYYDSGIDYSYCDIKYFKKYKDIITTIKNSPLEEKWIWFTTSIDGAERRLKALKECGIDAEFISAKENDKVKNEITETNKFSSKVLITTTVLDNGVNIKDETLNNMVIESFDAITFIQELGRKRMTLDNVTKINLYIPVRNSSNFNIKIGDLKKEIDLIELFEKDRRKFDAKTDYKLGLLNNAFYKINGEIKINELYYARVIKDYNKFIKYSEELDKDLWYFIKEQLKWLGLEHTFNVGNLIENVVDNEDAQSLEEYLNNNVGRLYLKEDKDELINMINLRDSRNRLQKQPSLLKEYLEGNFNLTLKSDCETSRIIDGKKKKIKHCWKLIKFE